MMDAAGGIPLEHVIWFAITLFLIGVVGILIRRNVIFILLSLELMMNAAAVVFIAAGAFHDQADGQVMFMFILALAAAEVAVALGLVVQLSRRFKTLDIDAASEMTG